MQVLDPEQKVEAGTKRLATVEVAMTRAAQEVQAAMIVAKKFPRNEDQARDKIKKACQRPGLAEESQYEYAKGGTEISGPAIRLLEAVAQAWGNCEAGVVELDRSDGKSVVMSYAVDLESNHREVRIFEVDHIRDTRKGSYRITDNREIYELVSNQGSRRRRACLMGVIPGDVLEEAVEECNKTLRAGSTDPLPVRIQKMVEAFTNFNVTPEMIAKKMGCNIEAISYLKLAKLRRIFNSIKDGMGDVSDFFDVPVPEQSTGKSSFGFGKKANGQGKPPAGTGADPPKTESPQVSESPAAQAPPVPPGPTTDEAALHQEARSREQAEAAEQGQSVKSNRQDLLTNIDALEDQRRMPAKDRSYLWKEFCGTATREAATESDLERLRGHLRRLVGGSQASLV